ncbi:MAG TPA: c-type cytochrome [Gaiellaceae bacterium]|nr:c-type cytochrome [Gaiellaceae bacterium]
MRRARVLAPALALPAVLAGCSKQNALDPKSGAAHDIATLWWVMLGVAAFGLALVAALLVGSWVRRRRAGPSDSTAFRLVVGLGVVMPILVISALFIAGDIFLIRDTQPPPASAATTKSMLKVRVVGHQFWWEVRYPGTKAITANEIHIPVRTPVELLLYTDDVIHSFWVPQLNRKQDMIPEQTTRLELYADRAGRYRGQCAEFCGLQHAHMALYVFAEPPGAFRRWLARESRPARGGGAQALFVSKCGSCHTIRGTPAQSGVGPDLTHVGSRTSLAALAIPNTPERMREWIRDPQKVKPGNQMPAVPLTAAQVSQLAAYLEARR